MRLTVCLAICPDSLLLSDLCYASTSNRHCYRTTGDNHPPLSYYRFVQTRSTQPYGLARRFQNELPYIYESHAPYKVSFPI